MAAPEICFPFFDIPPTRPKPRNLGQTIVSDWSVPLGFQRDWLGAVGGYLDKAKFSDHAGTSGGSVTADFIREKIKIYGTFDIPCSLGGIPFEIAHVTNTVEQYFERSKELGFDGIEISFDTIPDVPDAERGRLIKLGRDIGLNVYTEVGEKFPTERLDPQKAIDEVKRDLDLGSSKVTIENEEFAFYFENDKAGATRIIEAIGLEDLIFELGPKGWPEMPVWLVKEFSTDINVQSLTWDKIQPMEGIRRGLSRLGGYFNLTAKIPK